MKERLKSVHAKACVEYLRTVLLFESHFLKAIAEMDSVIRDLELCNYFRMRNW